MYVLIDTEIAFYLFFSEDNPSYYISNHADLQKIQGSSLRFLKIPWMSV